MKKLLQYIPLHILFFYVLGILIENYVSIREEQINLLLTLFCIVISLIFFVRDKRVITILTFSSFTLIGVFFSSSNKYINAKNYYEKFAINNNLVKLKITKKLRENEYYKKFEADVTQVNKTKTIGKVLVNIPKNTQTPIPINSKIICNTYFRELPKPKNPYQFNYSNFLKNNQIHKQLFLKTDAFLLLKTNKFSLNNLIENSKQSIKKKLNKYSFSSDELSIINILFLGEKQQISKELKTNYSKAGVIHILAISGLHTGILVIILLFILQPFNLLKNGITYKLLLTVLLLWFFAFFTGFSASVVRAVTMYSFVVIGKLLNRKTPTYFSIITSMLFLLILNPLFLFDVGFQLSYSAVFAIVWIQPLLKKVYKPRYKITSYFWNLITVSVAAQIGVLPLSIYYFNQLPGLFLIANLIVIPLLFLILILGIFIISSSFLVTLPKVFIVLFKSMILLLNSFIAWVAQQDLFVIKELFISKLSLLILSCIIIAVFITLQKRTFKNLAFLCTSLICLQLIFLAEKYQRKKTKEFIVFHKTKESIFLMRNGSKIYTNKKASFLKKDYQTKFYISREKIERFLYIRAKNSFQLDKIKVVIIDSLGLYSSNNSDRPIVLLQYSPKINLKRLIKTLKPKLIIADGSNYKKYVSHWKKVSAIEKTRFYDVFEKGAFIYKY